MSNGIASDIVLDGGEEVEIDPDVIVPTPPSVPQSLFQSLYSRAEQTLAGFHSTDKGTNVTPLLRRSPKILKSFTYLGTTLFGAPMDIDDRLDVFQDGIKLMSARGPDSRVTQSLNATAVALLHNEKQRPRPTNLDLPATQSLSSPYPFTRRVGNPLAYQPLPDPQLVFDGLLESRHVAHHPNGISSLAVVLATVISLSLLRIDENDTAYNGTSPYLDLSPLYGVNDTETDTVREKDGRGMLSPDCFYEDRLMLLPPAVSAFLILWNRNHNFIARHLLLNNEGKGWVNPLDYPFSPDGILTARLQTQDNEIFATARLINCVQFKNVVAEDFLKVLMGLPNVGKSANLDILIDHKQSEKGKGHDSSMEFALLHNWTSMMAEEDIMSIEENIEAEFPTALDQSMPNGTRTHRNSNRRQRDSAGLRRRIDSRFKDDDVARVLQDATEYPAGAPGACRISPCFRTTEKAIIERARQWKVCSFNDFRKFLGLKALRSFEEWNSNPDVARAAEELYKNIDNLELYPGLRAEQTMSGSGLGLGYTMTYGLLVDIVTIIRSDVRFTTEFTAENLTQWGYNDCTRHLNNGAFGSMLPKLLQRNLPQNYPYDNVYSLFPLTCSTKTSSLLKSFADPRDQYDFERPKIRKVKIVETKEAISYVFNKPSVYRTIYGKDLESMTDGYGYFLGFDNELLHDRDQMMTLFALIPDRGSLSRYSKYFGKTAAALIRDKSIQRNGESSIDIVRDVINVTCTRWVCEVLCGIPLPGDTATEMHEKFAALYAYIFRNVDPETGWVVRTIALDATAKLGRDIERRLPIPSDTVDPNWFQYLRSCIMDLRAFFTRIFQEMGSGKELPQHSALTFLGRIVKSNRIFRLDDLTKHGHLRNISEDDPDITKREESLEKRRMVANILGLAVVTSVNYAQACAQAVDFYLDDAYKEERKEIVRLSTLPPAEAQSQDANTKLMGYIREAQRLGQPLGLWRDAIESDLIPQGKGFQNIEVNKGDRIFADFNRAHMNPMDFSNPYKIDPARKTPSIQGMGLHKCPGISFVDQTMPELFKTIFRLKNLRRDPGRAGRLERFVCRPSPDRSDPKVYLDPTGETSHFPRSLSLLYDDDGTQEGSPSKPKKPKWKILAGTKTEALRRIADHIMRAIVVSLLVFVFLYILSTLSRGSSFHSPSFRLPFSSTTKHRTPPPKVGDVKSEFVECPTPTTIFQPYEIHTILPGPDGHPLPLEYTLDHPKPHKLSVVDIDERDMQMAIYIDDELRGLTRDFEVNKTMNCGEDLRKCLLDGFSAGVVVIRPGKHTARIQWVGKDYMPDTHDIDWGKEQSRRLMWQREYCA